MQLTSGISYEFRESLLSLRGAFFWLFIGALLSIIPVVDLAGAIILLIGFILLIVALGRLSTSTTGTNTPYRSTRNWLMGSIILPVVLVIYSVVLAVLLARITSITTSSSSSVLGNITSLGSAGTGLIIAAVLVISLAAIAVAALVVYIVAIVKLCGSLRFLSSGLRVNKLNSASSYLLVSLILSVISPILTVIAFAFSFSAFTFTGTPILGNYTSLILRILAVLLVIGVVIYVLQTIGYHSAYSGIDEFLARNG